MIYSIANIITDIPNAGDLVPRCREYLYDGMDGADIIIRTEQFHMDAWKPLTEREVIYMESGTQFYLQLLNFSGMLLHSSAVEVDGKAYLFSGYSGAGKSTHTRLWQQIIGEKARVFNDDKPALRYVDGRWYAYGTPWCGKDGININMKAPIAGICFLKQAQENKIRRLSNVEAVQNIVSQTMRRFNQTENLDKMLNLVESLVQNIPVFELENRPEPAAAQLSYETMRKAAEEMGL